MNAKTEAPTAVPAKLRRPIVGDDVHYFDETRGHAQQGAGPYAAKVVWLAPDGVFLKIFAPYGILDAAKVPHKSELDPKVMGHKKWWAWPKEKETEPAASQK